MFEPASSDSDTGQGGADLATQTARRRTLVLCFDGTAGQFDSDNSNVVKLFGLLSKDPNEQLCYYQPGIGTWFKPGIVSPILHVGAVLMDLAIAWYLDEHVLDGYRFLMQNYRAGDKVCLFGFSRGAYTARALAGMLHKVGLLPRDNDAQMPFAYKLYQREDAAGLKLCEGFKSTNCQTVKIDFVGVWDTVASVGVIMGRTLPFTNSNSSIRTFRHALSLDEHRARFRPNLYHRMSPNTPVATATPARVPPEHRLPTKDNSSSSGSSSSSGEAPPERVSKPAKRRTLVKKAFSGAGKQPEKVGFATVGNGNGNSPWTAVEGSDDVLEVWFSGCHEDVGGGSVGNDAKNCLSNIPLRWMVRQAIASGSGIKFDPEALEKASIDLQATGSKGELDELDKVDALQPLHDSLKATPIWWILEIMPMTYVWQDREGVWHKTWKWHLGKGRQIEEEKPHFHETVRVRSSQPDLGYKPKAQWETGKEVYTC
ncbi:hypothetical protein DFP72DRAFT_897990 [Ephemerocybe angulata]|uniref:T6SS Phospholipase effector Tle1-like catalytic domain-containing protein n=1 Tax=Ephemerocybe angulata TaxID=980116 RepID=A0A8H6I016_9AGAR|nr:hypothetical protein DFP72DRAFT_897990 [Tulosesus angulatus]